MRNRLDVHLSRAGSSFFSSETSRYNIRAVDQERFNIRLSEIRAIELMRWGQSVVPNDGEHARNGG